MPPRSLLFLVVLLLPVVAGAQGFNTFSGRNHPELDWQVAETAHFKIMYPARLSGIEAEAAPIAEASYDALSHNLGVTFSEKIRLYLTDEDEIANGFAVPLGNGYTNIWVHVNDVASVWTGREKWLRKVVAHELAHIFHYRAVRSGAGLLANALADPLPRFWTEGLAQYETERWDAQRGDRWLRTAVLDDKLSYNDGRSIWNGRLLYAVGNSQLRYFASQHGDSTLARLLAHRSKRFLGLLSVHDFNDAFEATVGQSYRDFYDEWRRHVNIYYNTLAGQFEPLDSLDADMLALPGQYYEDVQYTRDTSRVAVLALTSLRRPVRRLYVGDRDRNEIEIVAEGSIKAPVAWRPDGRQLAFARTTRGRYGALLNDLFLVDADGGGLRRLTHSRRAASPTFSPDGKRLAFVGNAGGTANVFLLDLTTEEETQVTRFTGDVQLSSLRWHPSKEKIAFARFGADGTRDLALLDLSTGEVTALTAGDLDERLPVWRPDGTQLAFTTLRDDVPNVFVYDLASGSTRRVTHLATGAAAHDWLLPDSAHAAGTLVVVSGISKTRDRAFRFDAARTAPEVAIQIPPPYAAWTTHRPPQPLPATIPPDASLITKRYDYASWKNLTHAASLVVPYYGDADDWGVFGFTGWLEPLAKHLLFFGGGLSVPSPRDHSFFLAGYVNNQWYPTIGVNLYRFPGSARIYGNDLLVEDFLGGDVSMQWPLDWRVRPYTATTFTARLRLVDIDPLNKEDFDPTVDNLPAPAPGQQADLRLTFTRTAQRPWADNLIHPLDGRGIRLQATAAADVLGADTRFLRGDLAAYGVFPGPGLHRIFLYGRAQMQTGDPLPQDVLGFSRYDDVQIALPGLVPFTLGGAERVRGYRRYALGDRVLFGSAEYRVPLFTSLQTRLLGFVTLGSTTLAAFADAGLVWTGAGFDDAVRRTGVGLEVKNALRIGFLDLAHAVGVAQPAADFGTDEDVEVYYRIRAAVPF